MKGKLPRSLAELAWRELRNDILDGLLPPGTPLLLQEQARRLGMSVIPVREAIARLQMEGLVVQEPQKGAFVSHVSLEDMEDVYRVRIRLETMAVELAARHITDADYGELLDTLDKFRLAYARDDAREGREHHRTFHLALYRLARSRTLDRIIPPLVDLSERYRVLSIPARGGIDDRYREHRAILDAVMAREPERAALLLKEHLERTVFLVRQSWHRSAGGVPEGIGTAGGDPS